MWGVGEGGGWVRQRLISEFVNSFGRGNLQLWGKSQGISETSGCGIHGWDSQLDNRLRFNLSARELSHMYPYTLEIQCLMQLRGHLKQVSVKNYHVFVAVNHIQPKICDLFFTEAKIGRKLCACSEKRKAPWAKKHRTTWKEEKAWRLSNWVLCLQTGRHQF